jgi:arylformamidase
MSLYRDFATQEEIDAHYNVLGNVSDPDAIIRGWVERGEAAAARFDCRLQVPYGPTLAEHCDVFPAGPGAPLHLFIHGGYWRRFSARDHVFVAPALVEAGLATFVVNYELCPTVTIDEIVRQVRAAIVWAFRHGAEFGADPSRLTISGHSAGGHLVAMALETDWSGIYGLPSDLIKGAVAISGVFDLGFVPYSYVQPKVQATWDQVLRLSPIRHLPRTAPPLLVAVGGDETDEFRRQSRDFLAAWKSAGHDGNWLEPAGKHHLTVLEELERPESDLCRALVGIARAA